MTTRAYADEEAIRSVEALADRALTPDEFRAWADAEIPAHEMADMVELIRWFMRRYPTPEARLRSARRRHAQALQSIRNARSAVVR